VHKKSYLLLNKRRLELNSGVAAAIPFLIQQTVQVCLTRKYLWGSDLVGFYYLLLLITGVVLIVIGALKKNVPRSIKIVIFLFVIGVVFIVMSLILLLPGSSDVIAELMKWNK
jgi:hypothetical protein